MMNILVIGGTRYFGKKLVTKLLEEKNKVTLMTRGKTSDPFGHQVERIICDRKVRDDVITHLKGKKFDVVYDMVCFNADEAKIIKEVLKDKTDHYVMVSSQSVYKEGSNLLETDFIPEKYQFTKIVSETVDYAEAKRQAESILMHDQIFKTINIIRFPIVFGEDDYTGRLKFHLDHVKKSIPIYFPNIYAKLSCIDTLSASLNLAHLRKTKRSGIYNIASDKPLVLYNLMQTICDILKIEPLYHEGTHEHDNSPYGIEHDWVMNVTKAYEHGLKCTSPDEWLIPIIETTLKHS